jgi:hypothetical protein
MISKIFERANVDVSKDLFIILEMGFATTDLDNFKILEDIPSFPVAFFIPILLPYFFYLKPPF